MQLHSVGIAIATREYKTTDGAIVTVIIGKPERFPVGEGIPDYFYAPFQILGVNEDMVMYSSGVDEIAAIQSAFQMVGARLRSTPRVLAGTLRWAHGDDEADFGFGNN